MSSLQKPWPASKQKHLLSRVKLSPPSGYTFGRVGQGFANELTATVATIYMLGKGLSFTTIGVVWGVFLIVSCVFSTPTGVWADRFGRRRIYACGMLFMGAGQFAYGMAASSLQFLFGAVLFGFGTALAVGSLQAWLVDAQIARKVSHLVPRIFANAQSLNALAGIVAGLYVGIVYSGQLEGIYFISGAVFIAVGVGLFVLLDENYGGAREQTVTIWESVRYYLGCKPLLLITYVTTTIYAAYMAFLFTWQPQATSMGFEDTSLGLVYAFYLAVMSAGSFIYGRIASRLSSYGMAQVVASLLVAAGIFGIVFSHVPVSLYAGIGLFAIGYGAFIPISGAWANVYTPSNVRASVLSIVSTVALAASVVLQIAMGYAMDQWGMVSAVVMGSGLALSGIVCVLVLSLRRPAGESRG